MKETISKFLDEVKKRNGHEPEFLQAVQEVAETVIPYIVKHDIYHGKNLLLRMVEPERLISFRVSWSISATYFTRLLFFQFSPSPSRNKLGCDHKMAAFRLRNDRLER